MKTSRRVDQQHVHPPGPGGIDRVKDHAGRVRSLAASHHRHIGPSGPLCQLLPGGGPEGIRGGNEHFPAVILEFSGKLTHRSGLSHPIDADDHNHRLLFLKIIGGLPHAHLLFDAVYEQLFALLGRLEMLLLHLALQSSHNLRGGVDADVPHDQNLLQFLVEIIVYG